MTTHTDAPHFHDTASLLRRRWKMIAVFGLAGALLSLIAGFILSPRYTAKAQLVVEIPDTNTTLGWLDEEAVQTRVQLLLSDSHLKRLLKSLASDAERPAAAGITYDELQRNLNAYKELHARVIAVTYTSTDPAIAALVANKSAKVYLDTLAEDWRRTRGDLRALDAQISTVRAQAQHAASALQAYRSASNSLDTKVADVAGVVQPANREAPRSEARLRDLERKAEATSQLYENLKTRQNNLISQETPPPEVRIASPATPPDQPSSPNAFLFIPPAVVIAMIIGAFLAITIEKNDTSLRNQQDVVDALGIPCVGLVPTFESAARSWRYLPGNRFGRGIAAIGSRTRELSKAAIALVAETARSLRRYLPGKLLARGAKAVPISTPELEATGGHPAASLSASSLSPLKNPLSPYSEAMRSVVLSTLEQTQAEKSCSAARHEKQPQVVLITSSVKEEGKTTLSVSFAAYASLLGRKVLLIDFDFRKPGVLEQLAGSDETGILEVLQGRPAANLIKHHPDLGIDYLPLPRRWADPMPLLQCSNLPGLLRKLGKDYDCVVVDSAPVLGITETRLLSATADIILFAVQWGSTRRDIVQHGFSQLQEFKNGARAISVITKVDLKNHSLYRFGDAGEAFVRYPYRNVETHRAA